MTELMQSEIFFFISSLGFIVLGSLIGYLIFQLIRATRLFTELLEKAEENVDSIGEVGKEILEEVRESLIYRFLFKSPKKKTRKLK